MSPTLDTRLSAVTVYPDRARVTRRGEISLEPGMHLLDILQLPLQLNPDSVRVAARGTAGARLQGVQVQRAFFTEVPQERLRELEHQVESLQDEIQALDERAELFRQNRGAISALLDKASVYATGLAAREMSVEDQLAMFDGLRSGVEKLNAELQGMASRRRELERRLQKTQAELDEWRGVPRREQYTAVLQVEVLQAGELTVELSYVVNGASWKPLYDLRLVEEPTGLQALELDYLAQVTQRTGEPWDQVSLVLSTARPALADRPPELEPWYIRPLPPPRPMEKIEAAREAPQPMRAMAVAPGQLEAEPAQARVKTSGINVSYEVAGEVSVTPDGAPRKVTVAALKLAPQLDYVTAPRLVEAVYRRARLANASDHLLLPGRANLYASAEFIGSFSLELVAPQEEIELYLGVEDRLRVERKLVRRDMDKRLIGGKRRLQYAYQIKLNNLLPSKAHIVVRDQIPVPQHEDVKVRLEGAEPKPVEQSEMNLLTWEMDLVPQQKHTLRFDFSVEYPQGMELMGLV